MTRTEEQAMIDPAERETLATRTLAVARRR